MKLNEKILYCRKRAGLSQEELAERVGVSRQAVSKWEVGDALPELDKLAALAKTFGVTTDWLLSDAEPEETPPASDQTRPRSWVDDLPGVVGRLARRWGWLAGIYIAVVGLAFAGIGGLARFMARKMFSSFMGVSDGMFGGGTSFGGGMTGFDAFGNAVSDMAANNPVSIMGTVLLVLGILLMAAGVILTIFLKKKSRDWDREGK